VKEKIMPTRFPSGVSTAQRGTALFNLGMPDPTKFITCFEDFCGINSFPITASGLAAASNETWTFTVTEGGAGDASSAVADINGGGVLLTTDAGDNDTIFVQHRTESYLLAAGKRAFFKIRFALTDANANVASIAQAEWYAGLMVRDTDPLSSTAGDGVTDGVFFMSEDGTQNIYLHCQKNATTGQLSTLLTDTLTVATQTEFAFYFDGKRYIHVYKDGVETKKIDLTSTLATYLPDTELTVSFGVKTGEAEAKLMTIDYIFCASER
jgi:hypothetical protein